MQHTTSIDEQLVQALRLHGASAFVLERFALRLRSRPAGAALPCPFCFRLGRESELIDQTRTRDTYAVRCSTCGDQIVLRLS